VVELATGKLGTQTVLKSRFPSSFKAGEIEAYKYTVFVFGSLMMLRTVIFRSPEYEHSD